MACNADFVQFIVDQCSGAGEIAVKKMMRAAKTPLNAAIVPDFGTVGALTSKFQLKYITLFYEKDLALNNYLAGLGLLREGSV